MIIRLDSLPPELVEAVSRMLPSRRDILSLGHTSKRNHACAREALLRYPGATDRAFNWAIRNGSIPLLEEVLQRRPTRASKGILRMACKHGHVAIFDYLTSRPDFRPVLEAFFEPSSFTKAHILYLAAHHGHLDLVKRIAALAELDVGAFHARGQVTPVAAALRDGCSVEIITALADAGADLTIRRASGAQLIAAASERELFPALDVLLDLGADAAMSVDDWELSMHTLRGWGKLASMIFLGRRRPEIVKLAPVAHVMLWTSDKAVIQALLDSGVDWTRPGLDQIVPFTLNNPRSRDDGWRWMIRQLGVTRMIVQDGAVVVPDASGDTPLSRAVRLQDMETFPFFFQHAKASGGDDGYPRALSVMLRSSRCPEITRVLVEHGGAEVNLPNADGVPPLLCVMQFSNRHDDEHNQWGAEDRLMGSVEVLLDNGADVNFVAPDGTTALQLALSRCRSLDFMRMLVRKGARVPNPVPDVVRPKYPLKYIYMAKMQGRPATAKLLVHEAGGNPDELPRTTSTEERAFIPITKSAFLELLE